jgi:hypothetical protein
MVTDSGELSLWHRAGRLSDGFGTTLYRVVWSPLLGSWSYGFLPPTAYHWKSLLIQKMNPELEEVAISELQAEPWVPERYEHITEMPLEEQLLAWDKARFEEAIGYAQRTGFSRAYLWGVEWWYWMKERHGHGEYWDISKRLFRPEL